MSKLEDIHKTVADLESQIAALSEEVMDAVAEELKTLPIAKPFSLRLRGYTPYFNDGEECTHQQNDLDFAPCALDDDGDPKGDWVDYYDDEYPKALQPLRKLVDGLHSLLHSVFDTHWELRWQVSADGEVTYVKADYTDHD